MAKRIAMWPQITAEDDLAFRFEKIGIFSAR
jgi:hypothetical protein